MRVAILGEGRIARAVQTLMREAGEAEGTLVPAGIAPSGFDVLVGALAGGLGPVALEQALATGADLIDLADLDTEEYQDRASLIAARGIAVYPAAGFCPGLVNLLLGHELAREGVRAIEVMAGSLSSVPNYFPFLWCFEDMVREFDGSSQQVVDGTERVYGAFGGERAERYAGIDAESYLCQSGFENLARQAGLREFTYRNLRPRGFRTFFAYLKEYGAFEPEQIATTKALLERRLHDNLSVAIIKVSRMGDMERQRCITVESWASAHAPLNSMQRVTAAFTVALLRHLRHARRPGLTWCEALGGDAGTYTEILSAVRMFGVKIEDTCLPWPGRET